MAYSDNPETLEKIRPMLVRLELGLPEVFVPKKGIPARRLAYKIHEALYIARLHPVRYPDLARAADQYEIRVVGKEVHATLVDKTQGLPATPGTVEPVAGPLPFKILGKQTATSIVNYILSVQKLQPTNTQFQMPQAALSFADKVSLRAWCLKQEPPWILLVADEQVTVTRKSRDITEDLGWDPEDEG